MVKLIASALGWLESDQEEVLKYLAEHQFYGIEIVASKLFGCDYVSDINTSINIKNRIWSEYHLKMEVAQAVWYGLNSSIFDKKEQNMILDFNRKLLIWAAEMGVKILVLGAPRNRNIPDRWVHKPNITEIVLNFFHSLGDLAQSFGICFALEPVNEIYNSNFLTTTKDTLQFIKQLNHPAIGMNFDFGSWFLDQDNLNNFSISDLELIKHIHISKPYLKVIEKNDIPHIKHVLKMIWRDQSISLEMLNQPLKEFKYSVDNTVKIGKFL